MQLEGKFLDTLRSRLLVSEIVGEKVKLAKKGREHLGLCPFHHEKTPSFTVNDEKEFYHCFGCGAHGDVIRFTMETHNLTFVEAVKDLARRAGLSLPRDTSLSEKHEEDLTPLQEAVKEASLWFQKNLTLSRYAAAMHYTEKRKLTRDTLKTYGLGFAPNDFHLLDTHLKQKGITEDIILKAGILTQSEKAKAPYDRFRNRLMFPIQNTRGEVVAFGGRILGAGDPKYLNSPETPLFSKGKLLYGYPQAKGKSQTDPLIIVEGYMDVISLHQAGFKGAVAPLGTALTEDQILLAWKISPEPILCFDGDAAGLRAAKRAAERVLPLLKPGYSLQFAFLPEGEDPDTLSQNKTLFKEILSQAKPLVDTLWLFLTQGKRFKTPEQKASLEKQCALWCKTISHTDVRKNYHHAFRSLFYNNIVKNKQEISSNSLTFKRNTNFFAVQERLLLAILINHPNLIDEVSDELALIAFQDSALHDLKEAILEYYAEQGASQENLKDSLIQKGLKDQVLKVLSPQTLIHGAFAKPSASLDEARIGWKEIFDRTQHALTQKDLEAAQHSLAEEMSEKSWQRLKLLKKSMTHQE